MRMSPKGLKVKVTQAHFDQSKRKDSSHCMIASALKEALPGAKYVSVDLQTVRWTDPQNGLRYITLTPRTAQEALIGYDQGEPFAPFTLRFHSPAQITKMGRGKQNHAPGDSEQEISASKVLLDKAGRKGARKVTRKVTRKRRRRLTTPSAPGAIPTILGGQRLPMSILSRREYGLRTLRK
jgi:hypothetical protein